MSGEKLSSAAEGVAGWRNWIEVPLVIGGALIVFGLMGLSVTDALLRSFLNMPIFGANDYAQILLSFLVSISLPLCVLAGRLIAIDTLKAMAPAKLQKTLDWIISICGFTMLSYLAWRAFSNALDAADFGEATLLLQLPFGPSYYAVAIGCTFAALMLLLERLLP
ncbi:MULTISPECIES: TRAP transporter small permease [unclassified Lentilitoribacter]|uniref:TRAP transporter small permease n=1 Tax=unclassified Lentilitoribacter TaxID=2647570 RepID=UPI0013A6F7B5|nr:TRAP transporter small permease [Lentilitoribacter sp. Alg239-R112]